ncbi:MAG: MotA/TolQ/ExbB proton channel family protein [Verrucomicrobia bacterium]|nr:MAG: MotA/TolQ/ExbB proton channel family protein [Verrucomicrobiota bacterium]
MQRTSGTTEMMPVVAAAAAAVPAEPLQQSMSLWEIVQTGGWLMYVLGALSIIGLMLVLYFLLSLRRERIAPRELLMELHRLLGAYRIEEAAAMCQNDRSPAASIARAAIDYCHRASPPDPGILKEIIEGEGSRQAVRLQNRVQYLLDIAVVAPMIGLLGTVMGMLRAFNAVALDVARAKPIVLAAGVSQALVTTAAGLLVGIPAMICYAYFRNRGSRLVSDLEILGADLLTYLGRRDSVELETIGGQ